MQPREKRSPLSVVAAGALIGIANIVPGVSGGTFALLLGVFDRIIHAVNQVRYVSLRRVLAIARDPMSREARKLFLDEWKRIDAPFLLTLSTGAAASILTGAFWIEHLLVHHHTATLAFFIGLIVPSIAVPYTMMGRWSRSSAVYALGGAALTLFLSVVAREGRGPDNLGMAFVAGAIGISAMILPGLCGSTVLMVMGQYQNILGHLIQVQRTLVAGSVDIDSVLWLSVFGAGMLVGIVAFARVLDSFLTRFRDQTLASLIGLVLGSLYVLWPFKAIEEGAHIVGRDGETNFDLQIATTPNRFPSSFEETLFPFVWLLAGCAVSALVMTLGRRTRSN